MDTWDDARLVDAVESALRDDPRLGDTHIVVEAQGGVITLRGTVHTPAQRERAASVAQSFGGSGNVRNDLQLSP